MFIKCIDIAFLFSCINILTAPSLFSDMFSKNLDIHMYNTWQQDQFHMPLLQHASIRNSLFFQGVIVWNAILFLKKCKRDSPQRPPAQPWGEVWRGPGLQIQSSGLFWALSEAPLDLIQPPVTGRGNEAECTLILSGTDNKSKVQFFLWLKQPVSLLKAGQSVQGYGHKFT